LFFLDKRLGSEIMALPMEDTLQSSDRGISREILLFSFKTLVSFDEKQPNEGRPWWERMLEVIQKPSLGRDLSTDKSDSTPETKTFSWALHFMEQLTTLFLQVCSGISNLIRIFVFNP